MDFLLAISKPRFHRTGAHSHMLEGYSFSLGYASIDQFQSIAELLSLIDEQIAPQFAIG
jgi:hypothetical protein